MPSLCASLTSACAVISGMPSNSQKSAQCFAQAALSGCNRWSTCSARRPRSRASGNCASACSSAVESGPPLKATQSDGGAATNRRSRRQRRSASGSVSFAFLAVADMDGLRAAFARTAAFDFEEGGCRDEIAQFCVAVAARVEVGALLVDDRADLPERRPAILVGGCIDRIAQKIDEARVLLQLRGIARFAWDIPLGFVGQVLDIDELVAGRHEWLRSFSFAETVHHQPGFADTPGEAGEVAVAGNDAEAIQAARIKQIHRVDDQRRVGGVLAACVAELLDGLDGLLQQFLLPAFEMGVGPVAVGTLDVRGAVFGDFGEQRRDDRRLRI